MLCRKEGIHHSLYYNWSKAFLEAGKRGLTWDTKRDATTGNARRASPCVGLAADPAVASRHIRLVGSVCVVVHHRRHAPVVEDLANVLGAVGHLDG